MSRTCPAWPGDVPEKRLTGQRQHRRCSHGGRRRWPYVERSARPEGRLERDHPQRGEVQPLSVDGRAPHRDRRGIPGRPASVAGFVRQVRRAWPHGRDRQTGDARDRAKDVAPCPRGCHQDPKQGDTSSAPSPHPGLSVAGIAELAAGDPAGADRAAGGSDRPAGTAPTAGRLTITDAVRRHPDQ